MITVSIFFNFASSKSHEGKCYGKYTVLATEIQDAQCRSNSLPDVITKTRAYFRGDYLKSFK
jgi:hypothetical protein